MNEEAAVERTVTIWRDTVRAVDTGDAAAGWLTRVLGKPSRLVRRGRAYSRLLPMARIPSAIQSRVAEVPVAFADAFPMLVLSEESLADLNHRLDDPIPMDRFRPNLVLRGCPEPYAEDGWTGFRVGGGVSLYGGGACVRCNIPGIDQQTGVTQGKEPMRTLAMYRREHEDGGGVVFGQNVIPEGSGILRVGDTVEVQAAMD